MNPSSASVTSIANALPPRPTFADVLHAHTVVRRYLSPTPLYNYPALDAVLGAEVWLKHENYQPIGAFKVRGGINFMAQLAQQQTQGVVTASTGNHGQSLAYAARLFHVKAVIIVPENVNPVKLEAMRANGADVRLLGAEFEEAKQNGQRIAAEEGLRFVSSGDEPALIAGVATHTLEVLQEQPDIEAVIVPVGGGSGAAGASLVAKTVNPQIRTIAVCAASSPSPFLTWRERAWRAAPNRSAAEGLATGAPFLLPQSASMGPAGRFPDRLRCGDVQGYPHPLGKGQNLSGTGWCLTLSCVPAYAGGTGRQESGPDPQRWQHFTAAVAGSVGGRMTGIGGGPKAAGSSYSSGVPLVLPSLYASRRRRSAARSSSFSICVLARVGCSPNRACPN